MLCQTINQKQNYICDHCRIGKIQKKLGYYSYSIQIQPNNSNLSCKFNNNLEDKENQNMDAFNKTKVSKNQPQKKADQPSKLILEIRHSNQQQIQLCNQSQKKSLIRKDIIQRK